MRQLKSFTAHGVEFRPCEYQDSRTAGYRWYAVTHHGATGMEWDEQHSPRFASKEECRGYAPDREREEAYLAGETK